jgi:hypothetical protein
VTGRARSRLSAAALALLLGGCREAPRPPERAAGGAGDVGAARAGERLQLGAGTFAFADTRGAELLALDSLAAPAVIRAALCSGGGVHPVVHVRHQRAQPASDDRQNAANFAYEAGEVFRVVSGAAPADGTCYLTADSALVAAAAPVAASAAAKCDSTLSRRAARAKGREVVACWPLATAASGAAIYAVEFVTVGPAALASLVLTDPARLLFADFPAKYRGPGQDVWRVDDQGTFSPEGFAILFLGRLRGTYVMGVTWMGEEGENAFLLAADSADALRFVTKSYRYLAPD